MLLQSLAFFTSVAAQVLSDSPLLSDFAKTTASPERYLDSSFCAAPNGIITDACGATFNTVDDTNKRMYPLLHDLVATDYFRYYKVDLSGVNCPFTDDDGMCGNRACAVNEVEDESALPEFWKSAYLSKLSDNSVAENSDDFDEVDSFLEADESCMAHDSSLTSEEEDDDDDSTSYCYPGDDSIDAPGVYVSLLENPERFTGYSGPHAHKIWRAVYQENCFDYNGENIEFDNDQDSLDHNCETCARERREKTKDPLNSVFDDAVRHRRQEVGGEEGRQAMIQSQSQCTEQRLFYRLLSGMHASVSTHLCYEHLNKTSGEWEPNLGCFMDRVGNHPERIANLYFNYAMVAKAVAKLQNYIPDFRFCREDAYSDYETRAQLFAVTNAAKSDNGIFDESQVFSTPEARQLKNEFRRRVKKVSQIMDCVGCDRCRLWGKLQVAGYGTALKILFELPATLQDDPAKAKRVIAGFRRSELVALINNFHQLSKSIKAVNDFRTQLKEKQAAERTFKEDVIYSWHQELDLVWQSMKFVLKSYIDLPANLWNLFLHYSIIYWNKFVGKDPQQQKQAYFEIPVRHRIEL